MGAALLILVVWCVFWTAAAPILAELIPALFYGVGCLIRFLFICLWEAVKLAAKTAAWLVTRGAPLLFRAGLFLWLLAEEMMRAAPADADGRDERILDDEDEDPFDLALKLLGLRPGFTQEEMGSAYKRAIRRAHPDAGGSVAAAQAVNIARDLIMARRGWA